MCIDIVQIWFGIVMGKFRQFLTELSARDTPLFSFPDNNLRKYQWIFTNLSMCIDIVQIWFGIVMGKFCEFLTVLSACDMSIFSFPNDSLSKYHWIFTKQYVH